jgi:hypothetical protein
MLRSSGSGQHSERPEVPVRVLAGDVSGLALGERVKFTILETTNISTLIDVNGTRIRVEPLPNAQPGTELFAHLTGTPSEPMLAVEVRPQQVSAASALPLQPGQQVTAHVLDRLPTGNLLIDVEGTPLEAAAPEGLSKGQELRARVEELHPQVVLRILPRGEDVEAQALQILRAHLSDRAPAAQSLVQLQQTLAPLVEPSASGAPPSAPQLNEVLQRLLPPDAPLTPEQVQTLVRDGGLQLEAKLAAAVQEAPEKAAQIPREDLKAAVLRVLHEVETTAAPQAELRPLTSSLAQHLTHIETQQALNLLAQVQSAPYQLQIPFFANHGLTTAYVAIEASTEGTDREAGGEERSSGHHVYFHLDLEGFGQTRIDAHLRSRGVQAIFYAERPESVNQLEAEFMQLEGRLKALGFTEVLLAARPLGQMTGEKRQKFECLAAGVPTGVSLVDVRA